MTVKRTRSFVRKHYAGETIRGPDGVLRPIVFPKAVAITVRYDLDKLAPGLFDAVADALDPVGGSNLVGFARHAPEAFLLEQDEETEAAAGLLRSGLLAAFVRAHPPRDADGNRVARALDILEAPWPRREEALLRQQFHDRTGPVAARSARLIDWILATGLERFEPPPPLPPIVPDDVRLVCWMAIEAERAA